MNFLLENSIEVSSNLEKLLAKLYESEELTEKNVTADITPYKALITSVIKRATEKTSIKDICSVIETPTSNGIIPVIVQKYVGKESSGANPSNMRVLVVADSTAFTAGEFISTNGVGAGAGKVLYVESGKLLVEVTSGFFAKGYSIDDAASYSAAATTITEVYSANGNFASFLVNYDGNYDTDDGELASDLLEIVNIIGKLEILCTTKSLSSGFTTETLSDSLSVYGIKYREELISTLVNTLEKLEKARIFKFMRDNAYTRPNIVLTNSYGVNDSILSIFNDLYLRINQSAGAISTNTSIAGDFVVVASSRIYRSILSAAPLSEVEKKVWLPSDMMLVEDQFANMDYLCVALNAKGNNSAVLYTPFSVEVQSVIDPVDFHEKIKVFTRSDVKNNPLATLINDQSKNEMMEITYIDGYESLHNVF